MPTCMQLGLASSTHGRQEAGISRRTFLGSEEEECQTGFLILIKSSTASRTI